MKMSRMTFSPSLLKQSAGELDAAAAQCVRLADSLSDVNHNLKFIKPFDEQAVLDKYEDLLSAEATHIKRLAETLYDIAEVYERAERNVEALFKDGQSKTSSERSEAPLSTNSLISAKTQVPIMSMISGQHIVMPEWLEYTVSRYVASKAFLKK